MEEELLTDSAGQIQIVKMKSKVPKDIKDVKEKRVLIPIIPIKVVPKKHVMSLMDTLLTLFIVTPLIVGAWQGTWDLMTVYKNVFPPWESFLLGSAFHLSFAIGREGLQNLIQFKEKTWYNIVLAFFLRRLYTYLFTVACIMNWRGGWIIYDEWFNCADYKNVSQTSRQLIIISTIFITGCLVLLRSLRSISSAPFVIGLDTKTTAFDFPTRFNKKISYITFYTIKKSKKPNNKSEIFEKRVMDSGSPRPFLNDLRGEAPTGFSSDVSTTTEENFEPEPAPPQVDVQTQLPSQPHSIQDIIQYIAENAHRHKELPYQQYDSPQLPLVTPKSMFKLYGTVQGNTITQHSSTPVRFPQDKFFPYKPHELSDINLMAPNSFRFAPNSMFGMPKIKKFQETEHVMGTNKPISLTLNVYPSNLSEGRPRFQGPGLTPRYRYRTKGSSRGPKFRSKAPEKMVLHLNIYPGMNAGVIHKNQEVNVV